MGTIRAHFKQTLCPKKRNKEIKRKKKELQIFITFVGTVGYTKQNLTAFLSIQFNEHDNSLIRTL